MIINRNIDMTDEFHVNNEIVDIEEIIKILCDEGRMDEWDSAIDFVYDIGPKDIVELPLLEYTLTNAQTTPEAKIFSIDAISRILPDIDIVVSSLSNALNDEDQLVRSEAAGLLRKSGTKSYSIVLPALIKAIKDNSSYIGTRYSELSVLISLVGYSRAFRLLFGIEKV